MDKKKKIRILIAVILFFLFLYANFYTIRRIARYGVEVYLYDKLLVAYQIGGMNGLKTELERVLSQDKMRHELAEARDFKNKLDNINDPGKYLADIASQKKGKINLLRTMRNLAYVFVLIILALRLIINLPAKPKS